MKKVIAAAILLLGVSGCAGVDIKKQVDEWKNLKKEHFAQTTTTKDDALETVATLNTINGHQIIIDSYGSVGDDDFFRAFIDKKTGKTTYQLYQVIRYEDKGWRYFNLFKYESPNGVQATPAEVLTRDVDCSRVVQTEKCSYEEHVVLTLDEAFMRWLAKLYSPTEPVALAYKVSPKSGNDREKFILAAEAAGLLQRVDEYLAAHGLSQK